MSASPDSQSLLPSGPGAADLGFLPAVHRGHGSALSLSQQLKEGTRQAHRLVERMAFVRGFLRGVLDHAMYQRLLIDLYYVYSALESGLQAHAAHPQVGPLVLPALFRTPALMADLDFLSATPRSSGDWRLMPMSPAAMTYCHRLNFLAKHHPLLLLAHCYTRYLGDLSGGQILRRIAGLALGLDASGGLAFYDFPQIPNIDDFKTEFRRRLDQLPLGLGEPVALVQEAVCAFTLSGALFDTSARSQTS